MQPAELFEQLTGKPLLPWQARLSGKLRLTAPDDWPDTIDLPTGLGKTMVMAIWLIARAFNTKLPRRLVYVVDRRTVVDQATTIADRLRRRVDELPEFKQALKLGGRSLPISTLRGQLADNRDWSRDPSLPAIVIGTVDLIGSGLLFSGYRSSRRRRPLEAGLLGQDSLILLDEAHLSRPFNKLVTHIRDFQAEEPFRLRVIRMSATSDNFNDKARVFSLEMKNGELTGDDAKCPVTHERFTAEKRLTITDLAEKDLIKKLADAAVGLVGNVNAVGKRIVVFVSTPDIATRVESEIRKHAIFKAMPDQTVVDVLTGTMRGLERDELVDEAKGSSVFASRWLNGDLDPADKENEKPVFLVSTSAGEVGFDLNADHLVCDAAPLDSMIQRLGRVNRRGKGTAIVQVLVEADGGKKTKGDDGAKHTFASATKEALSVLRTLPLAAPLAGDARSGPIFDASPRALRSLNAPASALSPPPETVDLTDILLDAWSMTSITAPMPGRPPVGPWLRGIADDVPRTTIVWRAELDLFDKEPNWTSLLEAVLVAHPIRPHECLTVKSSQVIDFLKKRVKSVTNDPALSTMKVAVKLSQDIRPMSVAELIDNPGILNAEPTLILPVAFGGLGEKGMLDPDAALLMPANDGQSTPRLDVADKPGYESRIDAKTRWRIVLKRSEDKWLPAPLPGSESLPSQPLGELLRLSDSTRSRAAITTALAKPPHSLSPRAIVKFDCDEEGVPQQQLLLLAGIVEGKPRTSQSLPDHVGEVECAARRIANQLELSDELRAALYFAARWHDQGKLTPTWQRYIGGSMESPLAKSENYCDPKRLAHYRHEFGSLLQLLHPSSNASVREFDFPDDETGRDLALHLIATHHGHGRPHFTHPIDRDFHGQRLIPEVHTDAIRRFARLQRTYGWWRLAWLENLLRCADAMASAGVDADADLNLDETTGDEEPAPSTRGAP